MVDLNFNAKTEGYLQILNEIADLDMWWVELDTPNAEALAFLRSEEQTRRFVRDGDRAPRFHAVFRQLGD